MQELCSCSGKIGHTGGGGQLHSHTSHGFVIQQCSNNIYGFASKTFEFELEHLRQPMPAFGNFIYKRLFTQFEIFFFL